MPLDERITSTDRMIYVLGVSSVGAFGAWIFSLVLLKMTFRRSMSTALLGLVSVVIANYVVELVLDIAPSEYEVGHHMVEQGSNAARCAKMTEAMTQDYIL